MTDVICGVVSVSAVSWQGAPGSSKPAPNGAAKGPTGKVGVRLRSGRIRVMLRLRPGARRIQTSFPSPPATGPDLWLVM